MAETIRGINIQIGAETTALSKALGDVNKRSRDIQSELKQVERLLKLDPGNTELIAQKQKLLSDSIENTSQKLDVMRKAQQQVNEQFERGEINDGQYRAFQRELIKTENELDNLRSGLNTVSPEFKKLSDLSEETAKKMADVGSKLSDVGKKLSVGLSAPIVGLGAIAGKAALDVDAAAGKMEASLGVTAEQAEELAEASRGIWKKGFGESLDQVNRALVTTRTNVQGLNNEQLTKLTQQALVLQQTFDADVNETTRTASVLMKNFGVDGNKAMDLITVGFQKGGDFSGELLDTLREYAPQFKALGISAEDAMGMLLEGTENGAFNLDKIGDALKEFNIRLKDGSDSTYEAMAQLFAPDDVEAFSQALVKGSTTSAEYLELLKHVSEDTAKTLVSDLGAGGKKAEDAFIALNSILGDSNAIFEGLADGSVTGQDALVAVIQKLREIEDPLYQNQLAVSLFGTQWEDLEKDVILALDAGIGKLQDVEGATDKAGEAVTDNLGTRFQSVLRELQSSLAPLGKALLDIADRVMPIIQSAISKFSKALSNMSPSTQTLVLGLGAIAAAVGPLLVVFGSLMGALTPLLTFLPTMGVVLAALTGPIGLVALGIAGIVAGGVALYKHMSKESIPEIQRFGDEVSKSTQKAVGGFLDLNDQATLALNQLQWSGQTVAAETAQSIVSTFSQMGDQVLSAMKEDHAAQLQEITNFYSSSSSLTEEEEKAALAKLQEYQAAQTTTIQEGQARIKEIMETASAEKRGITDAERNEINKIQGEMVQAGIKHMSESELEQKAILERMRQNASALSARQAAEVVKNSVKQRDEAIAAADKQYNDVVKSIIQQRDEVGSITEEQATKLIAEAKKQRDESVKHAQSMHNDVLKEAKAQAGSHVNQVNWETGEILKKWDIFVADVKKKWEQMKQWASNIFGDMWKAITTKTDEIKTDVTEKWNNVIDFFKNIDLKQIGADIMNGLKNGIKSKAEELYQEAKDIASNVGEAIRNFFGIKSPSRLMMGYGEYISEGLAIGIADAGRLAVKSAENLSGAVSKAMSVDPVGLSVAASSAMSGTQGSAPTGGVVNQYNMEGMFKGANFNVRNDEDIRKLSQGIGSYITGNSRGLGGVAT